MGGDDGKRHFPTANDDDGKKRERKVRQERRALFSRLCKSFNTSAKKKIE